MHNKPLQLREKIYTDPIERMTRNALDHANKKDWRITSWSKGVVTRVAKILGHNNLQGISADAEEKIVAKAADHIFKKDDPENIN